MFYLWGKICCAWYLFMTEHLCIKTVTKGTICFLHCSIIWFALECCDEVHGWRHVSHLCGNVLYNPAFLKSIFPRQVQSTCLSGFYQLSKGTSRLHTIHTEIFRFPWIAYCSSANLLRLSKYYSQKSAWHLCRWTCSHLEPLVMHLVVVNCMLCFFLLQA